MTGGFRTTPLSGHRLNEPIYRRFSGGGWMCLSIGNKRMHLLNVIQDDWIKALWAGEVYIEFLQLASFRDVSWCFRRYLQKIKTTHMPRPQSFLQIWKKGERARASKEDTEESCHALSKEFSPEVTTSRDLFRQIIIIDSSPVFAAECQKGDWKDHKKGCRPLPI